MTKSTFLSGILVVSMLWCAGPQAFGAGRKKNPPDDRAQRSVTRDFPGATRVVWTRHGGLNTAEFTVARSLVLATYDDDGKLELTQVRSDASAMPFETRLVIEKKYPAYQAQSMTECISTSTHCYYVLLKRDESHLVTWLRIRVSANGRISVIQQLHQKAA